LGKKFFYNFRDSYINSYQKEINQSPRKIFSVKQGIIDPKVSLKGKFQTFPMSKSLTAIAYEGSKCSKLEKMKFIHPNVKLWKLPWKARVLVMQSQLFAQLDK
jgi:hypothetical protein